MPLPNKRRRRQMIEEFATALRHGRSDATLGACIQTLACFTLDDVPYAPAHTRALLRGLFEGCREIEVEASEHDLPAPPHISEFEDAVSRLALIEMYRSALQANKVVPVLSACLSVLSRFEPAAETDGDDQVQIRRVNYVLGVVREIDAQRRELAGEKDGGELS